jgi:hypothetical protein
MAHLLDKKRTKLYEIYSRGGQAALITATAWPDVDSNWKEYAMPETPEGQVLALLARVNEADSFNDSHADWMVDALKRKKVQYHLLKDDAPYTYNFLYLGSQEDGQINDKIVCRCYTEILDLCAKKYPVKYNAANAKKLKLAKKKRDDKLIANHKKQLDLIAALDKLRIEYNILKDTPITL